MVTKGYQKGVYERVTKGISWKTAQVTAKIDYIEQVWASSTNALCGGDAQLV